MLKMSPWLNLVLGVAVAAGLSACKSAPATALSAPNPPPLEVRHTDAAGAVAILDEGECVVVDVRTPGEYSGGHLLGAVNIDFNAADFESRLSTLDREAPTLVYCRSGNRSSRSLAVFEKLGFQKVVHLDGGIRAWEDANQPVER